ncbi:hypothetical protein K2P47_03025 [Patescibacteria group bacterium]|nr:hypothetical protein [Patescibacteria group bacterium]
MKYILKFLGREGKKRSGIKSPVYVFFAEADATVKTKAYRKALRSASEDQMSILSKYDKEFAQMN